MVKVHIEGLPEEVEKFTKQLERFSKSTAEITIVAWDSVFH